VHCRACIGDAIRERCTVWRGDVNVAILEIVVLREVGGASR